MYCTKDFIAYFYYIYVVAFGSGININLAHAPLARRSSSKVGLNLPFLGPLLIVALLIGASRFLSDQKFNLG